MKLKPRRNRVVFKLEPFKERMAGPNSKIVLAEERSEKDRKGTILLVGEDVEEDLKPGVQILVPNYVGRIVLSYDLDAIDDTLRVCMDTEIALIVEE